MRQPLVATMLALCSACIAGPGLLAVEDAPVSTGELRLFLGMEPAYTVNEEAEAANGDSTSYAWEGADSDAGSVAVQYVADFGQPMAVLGQPILGFELLVSGATLTPNSFTVDGRSYTNSGGEEFSYLAFTPTAIAGWRFAKPDSSEVGLIGELQFLAGATILHGESSDDAGSNDQSMGFGFDLGARVLFGIKESGWTGALVAGVRRGWASIELDHDGYDQSYTSTLDLDRVGAELMLAVGHTF